MRFDLGENKSSKLNQQILIKVFGDKMYMGTIRNLVLEIKSMYTLKANLYFLDY